MIIAPVRPISALRSNEDPAAAEVTVADLDISGHLPEALDGRFLRIGPNAAGGDLRSSAHAFAGDGMVHGLRLRGGRAEWYRNRWVRTDRAALRLGAARLPGPRHGLSDNANGNIIRHGGRILALGEAGVLPIEIDGDLGSVTRTDFEGTLPGGFAAHPQRDPVTGELFTVAYDHELPFVRYLVVDRSGRVRRSEPISVPGSPMMHALSLTARYVILYDLPVAFDPALAAAGSRVPYAWSPHRTARIGVLPREGGDASVRWFEVPPCFVFHPMNAYEQGERIVVDAVRHDRVFDRDQRTPMESRPTLWRWTIDLGRSRITQEQLDDVPQEFPRIDDRRATTVHRFGYAVAVGPDDAGALAGSVLLKHDFGAGDSQARDFGPGRASGEAVFVPRTPDAGEDDGWLLTLVYDAATDRSDLVVLNGDDFTGEPQAVVHLPVRVPYGFHATWLPEQ